MEQKKKIWLQRRRRLFEIIEVGTSDDLVSRGYDVLSALILTTNLAVTILYTFDKMEQNYGSMLLFLEAATIAFFALDYCFRVLTAQFLYPSLSEFRALKKYLFSFSGLVDLLSFLPYYLPVFFPTGASVLRMFRVIRIFRLFSD